MGLIKRLLGLEAKPGEPETLPDEMFEETVKGPEVPTFVLFFNNWCSGCQVMHGLLNEMPQFETAVPTAENIAQAIFEDLADRIRQRTHAKLAAVRVIETSNNDFLARA